MFALRAVALSGTAMLALMIGADRSIAACTPGAADNADAVCSGSTIDQNAPNGYGDASADSLSVTVLTGASVTGSNHGIVANSFDQVLNRGIVAGDQSGIFAGDSLGSFTNSGDLVGDQASALFVGNGLGQFHNSGLIRSNASGGVYVGGRLESGVNSGAIIGWSSGLFAADIDSFLNTESGVISGGAYGVYGANFVGQFSNAGLISASSGIAFEAGTLTSLSNTGGIIASSIGVNAASIDRLVNFGSILGVNHWGVSTTDLGELVNAGSIAGGQDGVAVFNVGNIANSGAIAGGQTGVRVSFNAGSIANSGTIAGDQIGIFVGDSLASFTNNGDVVSDQASAVFVTDVLGQFQNSGLIRSDASGAVYAGGRLENGVNTGAIIGWSTGVYATDIDSFSNTENGVISGGAYGVYGANSVAEFSNAGLITASSGIAFEAGTLTSLSNTGGIIASSIGVNAASIDRLVNTGSILGADHWGVSTFDLGELVNTGSISGGQDGVAVFNAGTILNSGTIAGDQSGIRADSLARLTNSGLISGGTHAILEDGNADTDLTLLQGSVIDGAIGLGGGVNTLNIGPGLSLASTFESSTPLVMGNTSGVPYAVINPSPQTPGDPSSYFVAAADPTALFAQDEILADLTGGIFSAIESASTQPTSAPLAYAPDPAPQTMIWADAASARYWAQGFGGYRAAEGEGPSADSDQALGGLVSGLDLVTQPGRRAGIFVGGSLAEVDVADSQTTDAVSGFGGVYAGFEAGPGVLDLALAVGYSAFDSERTVANNLAPGGVETAAADYDGFFISPHLKYTQHLGFLEASGSLRYAGLFLGGYSESGSSANLTVDDRDLHIVVGRGALTAPLFRASGTKISVTGGIEARAQIGDGELDGVLLGQTIVFDADEDATLGGFVGLRAEHWTGAGTRLFAEAEGVGESDASARFFGRVGFTAEF